MPNDSTENAIALLVRPPTSTTTGPLVAAGGTIARIIVFVHAIALARVPLIVIVLVPRRRPKLRPRTKSLRPPRPGETFSDVMRGADGCGIGGVSTGKESSGSTGRAMSWAISAALTPRR
jgi:hypothetical protein